MPSRTYRPVSTTDRPTSLLQHMRAALLFAAGLVALATVTAACTGEPAPQAPAAAPGQPVRVAVVRAGESPERMRVPGVTRAVERAELSFLHAGHLAERAVRRGQSVRAGEPLAVLHNPSLMPGVAAAEARVYELDERLRQLEQDTERLEDLHQRGLVATEERDRVRSERNAAQQARAQAQARLEEAREQLTEATLRAPFAGEIVALHVEPGDYVRPGQPVISISAPERLEVAVDLSPRQLQSLAVGDSVTVGRLDDGSRLAAHIREIGLAAPGQPASAVIDLADAGGSGWFPGQPVHVELALAPDPRPAVPLDALVDIGDGRPHVFRVRDGVAERVDVHPGRLDGRLVRVGAALEAGDEVVIAGHGQLLDGEPVRVLR